ncbi:hypothetical protein C8J56DRAFT_797701 [Mycena floridula]|nr:hypothetical protein C8J56DRAFT_797701 [Mycena floridula]
MRLEQAQRTLSKTESRMQDREQELQNHIDHLKAKCREKDRQLAEKEAQFTETSRLLDSRTKELQGAQTFLATADSISGADVLRMVQSLNDEIFQTAAYIADALNPADKEVDEDVMVVDDEKVTLQWMETAKRCIGEELVSLLVSKRTHEDFEALVQNALQSSLGHVCAFQLQHWATDPRPTRLFHETYTRLRATESQAVSGRWRALTRKYAKYHESDTVQISRLLQKFVEAVAAVLHLSGWKLSIANQLKSQIEGKLSAVVQLMLELDKAMGCEVTSWDFSVSRVKIGTTFSSTTAVDVNQGVNIPARSKIIGTADLGLAVQAKGSQRIITLKPKVILDTTWDEVV